MSRIDQLTGWLDAVRGRVDTLATALPATPTTGAPILASGAVPLAGSLSTVQQVTVLLGRTMPDAAYAATASLTGGTGLLGRLVLDGIVTQTADAVTVQVRNTGLTALSMAGATVTVIALA